MKTLALNSRAIAANDNRLRGGSYSPEAFAARRRLKRSGFPLVSLGNSQVTSDIFIPPRFKRIFVADREHGVPYVTSAEMLFAELPRHRFLSKQLTKVLPKLIVRENWILIADSGTVGSCVIVTSDLDEYAVTNNAVRVIVANGFWSGYLYTYVSSDEFQSQITEQIYGSVIDHIEAHHVADISIPRLPDKVEQRIHQLVMTACDLRVQANAKLRLADERFHQANNLPHLPKGPPGSETGAVSSNQIFHNPEQMLTGSHYNRLAIQAEKSIRELKKYKRVEEVASVYLPTRFKRIRVESEYGIPFLTGRHILQLEPTDFTYISKQRTCNLKDYIIEQNWTLITRSGTVGRTAFVSPDLAGVAVTEDAIRVMPFEETHPGYLYAFLSSSYGYLQVTRYVHGSVIPHISTSHIGRALVPFPAKDTVEEIGGLVLDAMEKRVQANALLRRARALFDAALTAGQSTFTKTDPTDWLASWEKDAERVRE